MKLSAVMFPALLIASFGWSVRSQGETESSEAGRQSVLTPAPASDLESVQGLWARTETVGLFGKRRITKEIREDRETVTYYDAIGNVERAHTVKVDLRRAGSIRVFTYTEQKFTAGPQQGTEVPGTGSYVYKVVGDTFVEIWGVLEDEDREIEIMRWQRVKQ